MVAHDERFLYLVRQPREAVGEDALLELPAGKLDVPGESPVECAKRELAEEVGKAASEWRELKRFYTSPGFAEEEVIVYLATGLEDADAEPDEEERLEVVAWPLEDLDGAIEECARREVADRPAAVPGAALGLAAAVWFRGCTGRGWLVAGRTSGHGGRGRKRRGARQRGRGALRGAGARLPRAPGVRARPGSQHARRLSNRSAPVRDLPGQAPPRRHGGRAGRRRRLPRRPGDRQRPSRLLAGDDQPQGRLPAVLLPAPAARGAGRRRPHGGADARRARAGSFLGCSPTPR